MPCESCNIQFTVFRRKRTCAECKRFYCSNCLSAAKRNSQTLLCERCAIFSKRPLLHSDLLQLKPKDLIFYLQSKHISTTGCVEKDELIRLVLNHVDQNDATSNHGHSHSHSHGSNDSFDSLRQTCQNFFFNITENISDTLAAFDSKTAAKTQQDNNNGNSNSGDGSSVGNDNSHGGGRERSSNQSSNSGSTHIIDQPRVSRREIPTYASSLNTNTHGTHSPMTVNLMQQNNVAATSSSTTTTSPTRTTNSIDDNIRRPTSRSHTNSSSASTSVSNSNSNSDEQKTSTSSSLASPIISVSSIASQGPVPEIEEPPDEEQPRHSLDVPKLSDCECSDDEIFTTYTARNSLTMKPDNELPQPKPTATITETHPPASSSSASLQPSRTRPGLDVNEVDETSHSSFEELGAVGSAVSEDSGGSSNTEPWQIVEAQGTTIEDTSVAVDNATVHSQPTVIQVTDAVPPRRKLLRRRSDRQRSGASDENISPTSTTAVSSNAVNFDEGDQGTILRRRSGTCKRCGKSNLRRYVEKMRCHLESSQMSEADIKREMRDFLAYLEDQTKSVDYSETETTASPLSSEAQHAEDSQVALSPNANIRNAPFYPELYGDNDGIHVYGAEASTSSMAEHSARFVNLDDYDNIEDLESLSVKQLKEVLMLHRVDYKGCCEKQELLDRVQRLWKNLKSAPAVDRLPTDELCKICMDAPIECVILECGHMATCVTCGKVLSECPICRQYIVRVVRFFRA